MQKINPELMVTDEAAALWDAGELTLMVVPMSLPEMSQVQTDPALMSAFFIGHVKLFNELIGALKEHGEGDSDLMRQIVATLGATKSARELHDKLLSILSRAIFTGKTQKGPMQ